MSHLFKRIVSTCLLIASVALHGCSGLSTKAESTYIPASVFRDDVKNVLNSYGNEDILEHSIFRPQFLSYLDTINHEKGPIDIQRLQQAIATWNAVMSESNAHIVFKPLHFERLAGLSDENGDCNTIKFCQITAEDLEQIRTWSHLYQDDLFTFEEDSEYESFYDTSIISSVDSNSTELNKLLRRIYKDPVGRNLIEHCIATGVKFRVRELEGKHGYYQHSNNVIVIDPKILSYEFNMRYMIHEMVHAVHDESNNSIQEEVLAELIGLDTQNRITGIPMELHPYAVFVQHILHPDYGRLAVSNNIKQSLNKVGLEL